MSEALTKVQAEQLKILRAIVNGTLPKIIEYGNPEFSFETMRMLCDKGYIAATRSREIRQAEQQFSEIRMKFDGHNLLAELEQLAVPDHASEPATNPSNSHKDWHEGLVGKIGVGVAITVVGFLAVYLITHLLGLP